MERATKAQRAGSMPAGGRREEADDPSSEGDPRPIQGYVALLAVYAGATASLVVALRNRRQRLDPMGVKDLVLLGLATQHLSRLITKDSVLSPVRKPFTRFAGPAGQGEVNEEVVGSGFRQALGELISCPFCIAQWVATALVAGSVAAPELTQATVAVLAAAQVSDYLQLGYGALRKVA